MDALVNTHHGETVGGAAEPQQQFFFDIAHTEVCTATSVSSAVTGFDSADDHCLTTSASIDVPIAGGHVVKMPDSANVVDRLRNNGYRPMPEPGHDPLDPGVPGAGLEVARRDPPVAAIPAAERDSPVILMPCDGLRVIEIDAKTPGIAAMLKDVAIARLGVAPVRHGQDPSELALLYRAAAGAPGQRFAGSAVATIKVLGRGDLFQACGPDITWESAGPEGCAASELTALVEEDVHEYLLNFDAGLVDVPDQRASEAASPAISEPPQQHTRQTGADNDPRLETAPDGGPLDHDDCGEIAMSDPVDTGHEAKGVDAQATPPEETRPDPINATALLPTDISSGVLPEVAKPPPTLRLPGRVATPGLDEKRSLHRQVARAQEYPIEALGPLRPVVEALQRKVQAPVALCAQSVLGAVAVVAQAHRDVDLHGVGHPLSEIFVSIADSGDRKTTLDGYALRPIRDAEARFAQQARQDMAAYRNKLEVYEAAKAHAKKAAKSDPKLHQEMLDEIGPPPRGPKHPMVLVSDTNAAAIIKHLEEGRPYSGLFTSEAGILLGGVGFKENRQQFWAQVNALWDGEAIRRSRVTSGLKFLLGRRFTTHLMMQPVIAPGLFGDPLLEGMGTHSRMLVVAPETTAGTRLLQTVPDSVQREIDEYAGRIREMMMMPPRMCSTDPDALDPLALTLQPNANEAWTDFYNDVEKQLAPGAALEAIRPFGSKMAQHAGRLAGILTFYADPGAITISLEAMTNAIRLVRHYATELMRVKAEMSINPELKLAECLLNWLQHRGEREFPLSDVYQRGLNQIGDAKTARHHMKILEDSGFVERLPPGTIVKGKPRKEAWRLVE